MKKYGIFMLLILLIVMSVGIGGCYGVGDGFGDISPSSNIYLNNQQQGIWVSGSGSVWVTPDIANLRLGIIAQADTVAVAQEDAAQAMNSVITVLDEQGIDENDIQTARFSIQQLTRWDSVKDAQVVTGYQVTNIVAVKVRDVNNTGAVIDAVAEAGGDLTRIDSINFSIDKSEDYYQEARELAMKDAEDKAEQLADLSDVNLGKPTYISESLAYVPYAAQYDGLLRSAESVATSISAGELEVSINVQVAYGIEN